MANQAPSPPKQTSDKTIFEKLTGSTTRLTATLAAITALFAAIAGLFTQASSLTKTIICALEGCVTSPDLRPSMAAVTLTPLQLHAVNLIDRGQVDQALAELKSVERELDQSSTGSPFYQLQRGYVYKTFAQAFKNKQITDQATDYAERARSLFEQVRGDRTATSQERARAIHGIGNIEHLHGDFRSAIADYRLSLTIDPHTSYAWYDTFLAYLSLAQLNELDLPAMQEALDQTMQVDVLTQPEKSHLVSLLAPYQRP